MPQTPHNTSTVEKKKRSETELALPPSRHSADGENFFYPKSARHGAHGHIARGRLAHACRTNVPQTFSRRAHRHLWPRGKRNAVRARIKRASPNIFPSYSGAVCEGGG